MNRLLGGDYHCWTIALPLATKFDVPAVNVWPRSSKLLVAASLEGAGGDGPLYFSSFFHCLSNHPLLTSWGQDTVLDGPWDDQVLTSFCPWPLC